MVEAACNNSMLKNQYLITIIKRLGLVVCFFALYMFSRTSVHGPAEDAWLMVVDFTREPVINLFHPHHLLYGPLAHIWWKAWEAVGLHDAYGVIQSLNCILGAIAVQQIYALGRDLKLPRLIAGWAATAFGLSFAMWWLAAEIEAAPLAMLAAVIVFRYSWRMYQDGLSIGYVVVVSLLCVLAVATHVFHFSLALLVLYVIFSSRSTNSPKSKFWRWLNSETGDKREESLSRGFRFRVRIFYSALYLLLFLLGTLCLYTFIDYITGSNRGAFGYLIGYFEPGASLGFNWKSIPLFFVGLIRSIFGIEVMFRIHALSELMANIFSGKDFSDELFLVRNLSSGLVSALIILMLFASGILAAFTLKVIRCVPFLSGDARQASAFVLTGLIAVGLPVLTAGPVLYGSTANNEHLLPFWGLFFLGIALVSANGGKSARWERIAAVSLLISLFVINGFGALYAMKSTENDIITSSFSSQIKDVEAADLIVIRLTERDAAALSFITGAKTINTMHEPYPSREMLIGWIEANKAEVWIQRNMAAQDVKYPQLSGFRLEKLE